MAMETAPSEEEVDVGGSAFIVLRYERVWPRYVVRWSRRIREADGGSYPTATGTTESLKPDWEELRAEALSAAGKSDGEQTSPAPGASSGESKGLVSRIFRRR